MADIYMQKKCDFCGETIPVAAGRCPYCGSILEVVPNYDNSIGAQQSRSNDFQTTQSNYTDGGQPAQINQDHSSSEAPGSAHTQDVTEAQGTGEHQYTVQPQNPLEQQGRPEGQSPTEPQNQPGYNADNGYYNTSNRQYNTYNTQYSPRRPYYKGSYTDDFGSDKETLSNGMKVFLTILFTVLPGIGQLAGIITAIILMNAEDKDRKSFGVALLVACLIMFVLACIGCFILVLASQSVYQTW